jgi:flagellum-specific ATP synthase
MMTCFTAADVIVVGMIGERGREVKEFIEYNLGEKGLKRSIVIAAPADTSPLMRLHGAMRATAIAEYFRDQGKHVLLLLDSLTRYAQAQRELGLAIGEPPVTKGYPASVFSRLSQLVERAGNGRDGQGSITGFYTVLAEGDDQQDIIVDAARSFLDGHIVLSRELADSGYYPAIDIEASISRVMQVIAGEQHQALAKQFKRVYSKYIQNRDLISIGAYNRGSDPELDKAIAIMPKLYEFLSQAVNQKVDYNNGLEALTALFNVREGAT